MGVALPLLLALAPAERRGDPAFTQHKGEFCVGCYPGPPLFTGSLDADACRAKCLELGCACFDVAAHQKHGGGPACRITNTSTATKTSHAGFAAFTRDGWAPGPPPLPAPTATLTVDLQGATTPLKHFWRSCGWCPPDPHPRFPEYFAQEDIAQNHALIGSVPHGGIQYVRIHYLLDLIKLLPSAEVEAMVRSAAPDAAGMHRFGAGASPYLASVGLNFTGLDKAMDQLHAAGLSPGFEVMVNHGLASASPD